MASDTPTIGTTLQRDLKKAINNAIARKESFETAHGIRFIAAETIRDISNSWIAYPDLYSSTAGEEAPVDKLHFVYGSAVRLYSYNLFPDALPAVIATCFTGQIEDKRELSVGMMREILKAASQMETEQTKMAEEEAGTAAAGSLKDIEAVEENMIGEQGGSMGGAQQGTGKKHKADADDGEDIGDLGGPTAKPFKPKKEKAELVDASAADTVSDVAATGRSKWQTDSNPSTVYFSQPKQKENAKAAGATSTEPVDVDLLEMVQEVEVTATPDKKISKSKNGKAKASATPTIGNTSSSPQEGNTDHLIPFKPKGPGNYGHADSVKWYPDEDRWMKDHIAANLWKTWPQYEAANKSEFDGSYYVDTFGVQQPGMRDGRTANALRLRFGKYKLQLKDQAKAQAQGLTGAGVAISGSGAAWAAAGVGGVAAGGDVVASPVAAVDGNAAVDGSVAASKSAAEDSSATPGAVKIDEGKGNSSTAAVQDGKITAGADLTVEPTQASTTSDEAPVKVYVTGKAILGDNILPLASPTSDEMPHESDRSDPGRSETSRR